MSHRRALVWTVTLSATLLAVSALAGDDSSHAKLMGTWRQSDGSGDAKSTWTFKSADNSSDSIQVTNANGTQTIEEFACNTEGKECAVKSAGFGRGRSSKVSLWFNGGKLVEMETRGNQVLKRRFSVTGNGDSMDLEIIPIVPAGKSETMHFNRVLSAVARQ